MSWSSCRKFLLLASSILILASRFSLLASRQTIGNLHQHLQLLINPIFESQTSVLLFISEGHCRATFYFRGLLQGYFSFRRATSGRLLISEGCFSFSRVTSGLLFISEGDCRANLYFRGLLEAYLSFPGATSGLLFNSEGHFSFPRASFHK